MAEEIEYKFLVDAKIWKTVDKPEPEFICQGFIHKSPEKTVRVRIKKGKGFLTLKGKTEGISRQEFEYEIPVADAQSMLDQFTDKTLSKKRYSINIAGKIWEVDEFEGKLEGLLLAELEVSSLEEQFEKPNWVTEDVSTDPNYYNAVLIDRL